MKTRVLFLVGIAALSVPAVAQQFTETAQVTLVEIPVTVVDRAGKPVLGLTKDDFEVTDDGKKANVLGFETIEMSKGIADNATPMPPAAYRNFLLFFDLANSSPGTIGRAQGAAREFVKNQIGRRDLVAVATFTAERGLNVLTSFTTDKKLLDRAIASLGHPTYFNNTDPLRLMFSSPRDDAAAHGVAVSLDADVPMTDIAQWAKMSDKVRDLELTRRLEGQFAAMADLARVLDPLRGQKQIVLLTEGFETRLALGREDLSDFAVTSGSRRTPADTGDDADFGSSTLMTAVETMAEMFRRSGVSLHAIDIQGLRNESIYFMVRPAGGTVFKNEGNLTESFSEILEQQKTVYLLAIESKVEKPGKAHTLKVKVPSAKGAKVTHRTAYYEASAKASPLEQTLTLADIMMTDANVKDVPLSVTAMPLPSKSGAVRLPIVVEIPGEKLLERVGGNNVTANLFVYAFDEQYQIKDFLQQRIGLDLAKSGAALRGAGLRYAGMLTLPPGKYAVKALARVEETGRVGFLRTDIDVPATNGPVVLAPVFMSDRPGWINVAAPGSGASAVDVLTIADTTFVPSRNASLKKGGAYRVALFLYDIPMEALDITPMVIAADGGLHAAPVSLVGRTSPDAEGAAKVLLDFKPANLASGDYKLQFTVKAKGGQPSVVDVPFRIE